MKLVANRSFIAVKPKAPFAKWVNEHSESKITEEDICTERNLYMIEELEEGTPEEVDKFLKKHYEGIFINELWGWYTDEDYFPENISFKMFKDWFEYESIEMCWDTLRSKVLLEDD
ncbi:MAG: hypothetical protein KKD38_10180 [Candidatus Delongbacteria bacterium]|nr:hypothetical protein [Candidatus Delongbacteria bacterium]MCG2760360.1 hypothetical protein [Candidatus Delongbacteria bacterium]